MNPRIQPGFPGIAASDFSSAQSNSGNGRDQGMAEMIGTSFGKTGFRMPKSLIPQSLQATSTTTQPTGFFSQTSNSTNVTANSINSVFANPTAEVNKNTFSFGAQSGPASFGFGKSGFFSNSGNTGTTPFQDFAFACAQAPQIGTNSNWASGNNTGDMQTLPLLRPIFEETPAINNITSQSSVFKPAGNTPLSGINFGASSMQSNPNLSFMQFESSTIPSSSSFGTSTSTQFNTKDGRNSVNTFLTTTPTQIASLTTGQKYTPQPFSNAELPHIFMEEFNAPEFSFGKIPCVPPLLRHV